MNQLVFIEPDYIESDSFKAKLHSLEKEIKDTYLGIVYAVEYGDKLKIGCTSKPYTRVMALKRGAEKYGALKIGKICVSTPHTNYKNSEKLLHKSFESQRIIGTELFDLSLTKYMNSNIAIDCKDETSKIKQQSTNFCNMMKNLLFGGNL